MKNFKARKAYLVFMVIMSVFISSSLVYGALEKPGEAASFEVINDEAGLINQGIITLVGGMSGTATASALVTGFHDTEADFTETPATTRPVNGKIRTAKSHSASGGCQDSCSLY